MENRETKRKPRAKTGIAGAGDHPDAICASVQVRAAQTAGWASAELYDRDYASAGADAGVVSVSEANQTGGKRLVNLYRQTKVVGGVFAPWSRGYGCRSAYALSQPILSPH